MVGPGGYFPGVRDTLEALWAPQGPRGGCGESLWYPLGVFELFLAFIANLLGRRDDNTTPEALPEAGAPDEVEDDTTAVDVWSEATRVPTVEEPVFPPPPVTGVISPFGEAPDDGDDDEPDAYGDEKGWRTEAAPPAAGPTVEEEPITVVEVLAPPKETPEPAGITTVGAWAGSRSLARPERYVKFAVAHGINRLDIVVNDHSKWRGPHKFTLRNPDKIVRLAQLAREAGIEVHLMSWLMPHGVYIKGAADKLPLLAEMCDASSIQWDAEEPWMLARDHDGHARGAERVAEAFKHLGLPMGVNGIGYASVRKMGPLAEVCDYVVPQIYSTRTNGLDPKTAPAKFHKRWTKYFKKPIVMGLAAYRQSGISGYPTETDAMQSAVDAARATGVDTVLYWSLYHITRSPEVAKVIAGIRQGGPNGHQEKV